MPNESCELARSPLTLRERALTLRGLAQKSDPLAVELFDFQARALGLHVANLVMALDPGFVVIGGGLMDPEMNTNGWEPNSSKIWIGVAVGVEVGTGVGVGVAVGVGAGVPVGVGVGVGTGVGVGVGDAVNAV